MLKKKKFLFFCGFIILELLAAYPSLRWIRDPARLGLGTGAARRQSSYLLSGVAMAGQILYTKPRRRGIQ
jgi:hypothetical protein